MAGAPYRGWCINHPKVKSMTNGVMCEKCFQKQNEELRKKIMDVETYNEDRLLFLLRKSKELDLGYSKKEIKRMVRSGMTDALILKTKRLNVWTYDCEVSGALPIETQSS